MNTAGPDQAKRLQPYMLLLSMAGYLAVGVAAFGGALVLFVPHYPTGNSLWMLCMCFIGIVGASAFRILKLLDARLRLLEQALRLKDSTQVPPAGDRSPNT